MKSVIDIYVYDVIWLTYRLRPIYYTFDKNKSFARGTGYLDYNTS
jgi:hypothetical protein